MPKAQYRCSRCGRLRYEDRMFKNFNASGGEVWKCHATTSCQTWVKNRNKILRDHSGQVEPHFGIDEDGKVYYEYRNPYTCIIDEVPC